jgi:hypothetical protein
MMQKSLEPIQSIKAKSPLAAPVVIDEREILFDVLLVTECV